MARRISQSRKRVDLPTDDVSDRHMRILDVIRRIPTGRVCTYGRVAELAGLPGRSRLVGTVLRDSPLADATPWHRVVNAGGRISLRDGAGPDVQMDRLLAEGVEFLDGRRVDLSNFLWKPRNKPA
mgnify:CR=1 FL=1